MSCSCPPNSCSCCVGERPRTPEPVENRAGLPALRYRAGSHPTFLSSMLSGISSSPPLDPLTTRDPADFTIALADAWASVLDVLTFYQERIANEGYLRTAAERRSVLELAAEIGYRLGPGQAASTRLAFFLETAPGTPASTTIPAGTKVQSLPGPGETPQTFETVEEITAYQAWNTVAAQQSSPVVFEKGSTEAYLEGVATNLKPGDYVLFLGKAQKSHAALTAENWDFRKLVAVEPDALGRFTRVAWEEGLGHESWKPPYGGIEIYALRTRAQLFGHSAPDWTGMPSTVQTAYVQRATGAATPIPNEWPGLSIAKVGTVGKNSTNPAGTIFLDALYAQIVPGSWVVLSRPGAGNAAGYVELYQVAAAAEDSRSDFTFAAKTTRLTLKGEHLDQFNAYLRQTLIFGESELLPTAGKPLPPAVSGSSVTLDTAVAGLAEGMPVMVSETRTGELFPFQQEIAWIDTITPSGPRVTLGFTAPLRNTYSRENVRFNFNVAPATHGETRREVLGSGDASRPNQSFALKQKPLTYVSSATAAGRSSTLSVYVDGVAWTEVESLYAQAPGARVYVTRIADGGEVSLQTGDGVEGARLPTGLENLRAVYRTGTGLEGLVKAGQLSLLMTRPLGVKSVTNPEAPTGAENPEAIGDARQNAPLQVLTFGRIVSVLDFERYARAFPGIAKARADLLWDGENRLVYLTVALDGDAAFDPESEIIRNLHTALRTYGDPFFPFELSGYVQRAFRGSARIRIETGRVFAEVRENCLDAMAAAFSFKAGVLARSLARSGVMAVLQSVPGVVGVDLETLDYAGTPPATLAERLEAHPASWEQDVVKPAELLVLAPGGFEIAEMTP